MPPPTPPVPDLDPARWRRVRDLLDEARAQPADTRTAWLATACDDADLRTEVEALLAASEAVAAGGFLAGPAADGAAALFDGEADPYVGRVVGPWRLAERIGEGGMGVVYRAERADGAFAQTAALKLVAHGLAPTALVERFRRERQILAGLEHPGVARLLGGGVTEDGQPFFAMELVRGEPITAYADARALGVAARLRLVLDVCEAVAYAHRNLVVHRDLKPSNVVVADDAGRPVVKLLDFGIAKLMGEEPDGGDGAPPLTRTGALMTPEYAAPEQVRGEPITTATDVYALGVLLYELLAGRRPYDVERGAPPTAVERVVCETEPPPPSSVAPPERARRLRGDLDTIVLKALEKEPARRYASAEALADDLRRHLDGLPVTARRATAGYRIGSFVRRYPAGVGLAAVAVLALMLGLAGTLWQARAAAAERDRAVAQTATAEAVERFLVSLFESSDPTVALGDTVSAREVLERGVERVHAELAAQPEVRARVLDAMATVYRHLGRFDDARQLVAEGLAALAAAPGAAAETHVRLTGHLAELAREQADLGAADSLSRAAVARARALPGPPPALLGEALTLRGGVLYTAGELDAAEAVAREAVATLRRAAPAPSLAVAQNDLGLFLLALGRYDEADSLFGQALELRRRFLGDGHPEVAVTLANLATTRYTRGDAAGAEAPMAEALAIQRRAYGERHPAIAVSLNSLASILLDLERYDEAERLYREALAIRRAAYGERHPAVASTLNNLASLLKRRERHVEAERLYREALAIKHAELGPDHPSVAVSLNNLASVLALSGRAGEAERLYREAVRILEAALPPAHPNLAVMRYNLADLLADHGRGREAEELLRAVLPVFEASENRRLGRARLTLATLLAGRGQAAEARTLADAALEVLEPEDPDRAEAAALRARLAGS